MVNIFKKKIFRHVTGFAIAQTALKKTAGFVLSNKVFFVILSRLSTSFL